MLSVFGGKVPHQHGLIRGGVTVRPAADRQMQFLGLLTEVETFIRDALVPDTELVAKVYADYFPLGQRPGTYLSYGLFEPGLGGHYPAGVIPGNAAERPAPEKITEDIDYAWFKSVRRRDDSRRRQGTRLHLGQSPPLPRASHGRRTACPPDHRGPEVPRPRRHMDRLLARAYEAASIAGWMRAWVEGLPPQGEYVTRAEHPVAETAIAMHDAPRGVLLHGMTLAGETIKSYRIITPTTWNFSPKDRIGQHGPAEEALIGTELADPSRPVEIGRIVRAFDPCLSCATHHVIVGEPEHRATED